MIWYTYRAHMFIIWKAIHIRIKCGEIAYGLYCFSWRVKWGKLGELVDGIHESLCNKQIENYNTLYDFSVNDLFLSLLVCTIYCIFKSFQTTIFLQISYCCCVSKTQQHYSFYYFIYHWKSTTPSAAL